MIAEQPIFRVHTPGPPLAWYIERCWYYRGPVLRHARERVLPDGAMALIVSLRDEGLRVYDRQRGERSERLDPCAVAGVRSRYAVIDTAGQAPSVGVQFRPGGAGPLLGVPPGELRDAHLPLAALWGAAAGELRERLLLAATPEEAFQVLERTLLVRLARAPAGHPAIAAFLRAPHAGSIRAAAERSGLSHSRFLRLFSAEVGLPPKLFCRIRRFQRSLHALDRPGGDRWADLAVRLGYFDQAHLIHDFRSFAGVSPRAYLARRAAHRNHVALAD